MKKLMPFLLTLLFIVAIAIIFIALAKKEAPITVVKGNLEGKPLPIKLKKTNCPECAMLIETQINSVEVAAPNGNTWFFDDPGCMVKWIQKKPFKDKAKIWVFTIDTHRWIDAKKAFYETTYHSAMHYGFGAREKNSSNTINFNTMVQRMLHNQTMANPKFRKKLLGNKNEQY